MTPAEHADHPVDALAFRTWVHSAGARGAASDVRAMLSKDAEVRTVERKLERQMVYGLDQARLAKL